MTPRPPGTTAQARPPYLRLTNNGQSAYIVHLVVEIPTPADGGCYILKETLTEWVTAAEGMALANEWAPRMGFERPSWSIHEDGTTRSPLLVRPRQTVRAERTPRETHGGNA